MAKGKLRTEVWLRISLLGLAVSAFVSLAQATPIMNFAGELDSSKPAGVVNANAPKAPMAKALTATKQQTMDASIAGPSLCELTGTCKATLKVPEPQSLLMMGTGLLSMAGVIRRKLLR